MTNQEAIEYLDKYVMNVAPYGKWKEVVELAISAIQEQEAKNSKELSSTQKALDTISRQAAIDAIYETFCYAYCDNCEKEMNEDLCGDCHRKYQNWSASKKTIEKVINNLPSVMPKQKIGGLKSEPYRRLVNETDECCEYENGEWWSCSFCNKSFGLIKPEYNYCPNCGAKMEENHE